ncbi:hypothetical protein E2C01_063278 [Portunus trituberculatus]|uniref:Uncharacterized protein n=1 Tax=Portunus trituberculatus TaxID=210409 RepID=A0A5B7HKD6_PORTR|nr:hypothetical protein [Portunus trituberculatus]
MPDLCLSIRWGFCLSERRQPQYGVSGTINGAWTFAIVRNTGYSCILVSEVGLPDVDITNCRQARLMDYLG